MATYEELAFEWSMLCQECTECWTQTDLQLAAHLGKSLLDRNHYLEATVKKQQSDLDDRRQEIEYLTKHANALKTVNESRLRIYEQLEISIQELEKTNQRLTTDAAADKRKFKSLQNTTEALEARICELQKSLNDARATARGRLKNKIEAVDDAALRRSVSCEHSGQEDRLSGTEDSDAIIEKFMLRIRELQNMLTKEATKREKAEIELSALAVEHDEVLQQMAALQDQQSAPTSLQDELNALDEADAAYNVNRCRKCLCGEAETASTVYDLSESIEDEGETSFSSGKEGCLVRLANGAIAWGSQESLASMGQVISHGNSNVTSPATDISEALPQDSLLSELEGQYRALIAEHEKQLRQLALKSEVEARQANSLPAEADVISGPLSFVLTNGESSETDIPRKCQRCSSCSCGLTAPSQRPKSNLEEFSEVETSSSGFSEGESRLSNKMTQTEWLQREPMNEITPVIDGEELNSVAILDLKSPINPCDKRFQSTPGYKKLFQEIFTVLKKTDDEGDEISDWEHAPSYAKAMSETSVSSSKHDESTCTVIADDNASEDTAVVVSSKDDEANSSTTVDAYSGIENSVRELASEEENRANSQTFTKPLLRPNSLELSNNHNSPSLSKQRKQRRQQPTSKAELALLRQTEQHATETVKSVKPVIVPPKAKSNSRSDKGKTETIEREAPPKIIGSKVDLMGLCERHRLLQNKRKNRKNRSRNSSKPRTCLQITSIDELNIIAGAGNCSLPATEMQRQKPTIATPKHIQRHQAKLNDAQSNSSTKKVGQQLKISMPSVEVARLRRLEMTYAQVLKAQWERSANRRAM